MSVWSVSGPYSLDDTLDFEPLEEFLSQASTTGVDAVILMGPFVDAEHPLIRSGQCTKTPQELFDQLVMRLKRCFNGTSTHVIMVPSVRDIHHAFVFPQPTLSSEYGWANLHFAANPATFAINEVVFGVCTMDILMHLTAEEIARFVCSKLPILIIEWSEIDAVRTAFRTR